MFLDTLQGTLLDGQFGPRLASGLRWLARVSADAPDGRVDIDGDAVYALVQSYDTAPAADKKYESHRLYADVQYIIAGTEVIHYAPASELRPLTAYDSTGDCLLYADPEASTPLHMTPGTFAIFHPQDGHKPGCMNGAPSRVKKVVIKIRL
jgi:biofilm protein TabA